MDAKRLFSAVFVVLALLPHPVADGAPLEMPVGGVLGQSVSHATTTALAEVVSYRSARLRQPPATPGEIRDATLYLQSCNLVASPVPVFRISKAACRPARKPSPLPTSALTLAAAHSSSANLTSR